MKSNDNTVTIADGYAELLIFEKGMQQHLNLIDLIADFLYTGDYYYYFVDSPRQTLSNQHKNILQMHGMKKMPESLQEIIDIIHPDDIEFVIRAEEAAHRYIVSIGIEYIRSLKCCYCFRMQISDGTYRLFYHQSICVAVDSKFRIVKSLNIHTNIEHVTQVNNRVVTIMGINGNTEFRQISIVDTKKNSASTLNLTVREKEIIRYISKGLSSDKIADILGITSNTCRTHRKNIFRKIGCHSVASLIKKATDLGFLSQT